MSTVKQTCITLNYWRAVATRLFAWLLKKLIKLKIVLFTLEEDKNRFCFPCSLRIDKILFYFSITKFDYEFKKMFVWRLAPGLCFFPHCPLSHRPCPMFIVYTLHQRFSNCSMKKATWWYTVHERPCGDSMDFINVIVLHISNII